MIEPHTTNQTLEEIIHERIEALNEKRCRFILRALLLADHVSLSAMKAALDLADMVHHGEY